MSQNSATPAFKGPLGLFACLLLPLLGAALPGHTQELPAPLEVVTPVSAEMPEAVPAILPTPAVEIPAPIIPEIVETPPATIPTPAPAPKPSMPHSMYEGRPNAVPINSIEIQGIITATDPALRPWSERITPVAIRYPGIDLASAVFQDKASARSSAFNNWLAEKWIDRNARCNSVFQRDPRSYPWEGPDANVLPQCSELNRPAKDLVATCEAPATTHYAQGILRLRWLCTLASGTIPVVYEEAIPSPRGGAFAAAVNPASKERSRIPIQMLDATSAK